MPTKSSFSVFCNHKCRCLLLAIPAVVIKIMSVAGRKSELWTKLEQMSAGLSKYKPFTNHFYKHFRYGIYSRPENNSDFLLTTFQFFNISKTHTIKSPVIHQQKIFQKADETHVISPRYCQFKSTAILLSKVFDLVRNSTSTSSEVSENSARRFKF